jgi:hypothetical protein
MAIIQLQPKEIAQFWDGIKVSLARSNEVTEEYYYDYMNNALKQLLSGKMSCWVVFDYTKDNLKQIHAMMITSIRADIVFGYTYVYVEGLYGFRKLSDAQALDAIEQLKKYARNVGCRYIRAVTENERAKQIAVLLGFDNFAMAYSLEV